MTAKAEPSGSMSRGHRFARDAGELDADERDVAELALAAAEGSFASFEDHPDSYYYKAPDRSPRETWDAVTREVGRVTGIVAVDALRGNHLSAEDLQQIHPAIFRPVFGEQTLSVRRFDEQVSYGIVRGTVDSPEYRSQRGISARQLGRRLADIAASLDRAVDDRDQALRERSQRTLGEAILPAAREYARFLSAHPYFDGNGRTAFPLLTFGLVRLGALIIAAPETVGFHVALGRGMRRTKPDYLPLADHLEALARRSQ